MNGTGTLDYERRFFDPAAVPSAEGGLGGTRRDDGSIVFRAGSTPDDVYVYNERTILAVNIALATNRPLLVSGEPGCGKSRLADSVAAVLGRRFYRHVVTSRMRARDLLWEFDALRRLNDANVPNAELPPNHRYVEPGTLWWALDPDSARRRGNVEHDDRLVPPARDPGRPPPKIGGRRDGDGAVVLIDEIDKADPDVPNDLLVPIEGRDFTIVDTNDRIVAQRDVLLMMTTNGERELPDAFMRRCVTIELDAPTVEWFVEIAEAKRAADRGDADGRERRLHEAVAEQIDAYRTRAADLEVRKPSTAEFLDAIRVCNDLNVDPDSPWWRHVAQAVAWKHDHEPAPPG